MDNIILKIFGKKYFRKVVKWWCSKPKTAQNLFSRSAISKIFKNHFSKNCYNSYSYIIFTIKITTQIVWFFNQYKKYVDKIHSNAFLWLAVPVYCPTVMGSLDRFLRTLKIDQYDPIASETIKRDNRWLIVEFSAIIYNDINFLA